MQTSHSALQSGSIYSTIQCCIIGSTSAALAGAALTSQESMTQGGALQPHFSVDANFTPSQCEELVRWSSQKRLKNAGVSGMATRQQDNSDL
jgi:hypothetical protein